MIARITQVFRLNFAILFNFKNLNFYPDRKVFYPLDVK